MSAVIFVACHVLTGKFCIYLMFSVILTHYFGFSLCLQFRLILCGLFPLGRDICEEVLEQIEDFLRDYIPGKQTGLKNTGETGVFLLALLTQGISTKMLYSTGWFRTAVRSWLFFFPWNNKGKFADLGRIVVFS